MPAPAAKQPPAAAQAAAVPAKPSQPDPRRTAKDSTTLVIVYNRSPATYTHGFKSLVPVLDDDDQPVLNEDGSPKMKLEVVRKVIVPPGGTGEVPENVAETWQKISNGLVLPEEQANAAARAQASALEAEKQKSSELAGKLAAAEKRLAELDAKAQAGD
jgi:hypothetical protein